MKNLFCFFLEQIQLIFNYQHWYRWVVGAIIIFAFDYQILMGIKVFQPVKDLIPLLKSGIAAAVNAQHQDKACVNA